MKAIVLAGGEGVRMRPLTHTRPKALLQVAGKPLIWHVLSRLKEAGISEAGVVVKYRKEMVIDYLRENSPGPDITFIEQGENQGTGAALLDARDFADDDFLMVAADNICDPEFYKKVMAEHEGGKTIAVKKVENPTRFGVAKIENSIITDFIEKPEKPPSNLANVSIYCFSPSIFEELTSLHPTSRGEYEVVDVFKGAKAVEVEGFWMDAGYSWHLFELNQKLLGDMEASTEKVENSSINGKIIMEEGAEIVDSRIEGIAYIGKNSRVGPHSYLRGSVSIGENCNVGESTTLKDSILFNNVSAKHLSYIGDSVVGEGVNFGAGTQIANYRFDAQNINVLTPRGWINSGRKKLGCIIGDNVKFGVLACTMPGKTIGNGCWIGSNVNVTRNVKPNTRIFAKQDYVYQEQGE
ncbi:NTP transferase domain-containing protein [Candidatus Micrarchaeota archaeon]|nr:NTP transferase domain-containing protein [Candidatus Micrarchaeota archaeon]